MLDAACPVPVCWTCTVIATMWAITAVPCGANEGFSQFAPLAHNLQFLKICIYINSVAKLMDCISTSSVRNCEESLSSCLPSALTSIVVTYLISLRE